jgi:hypothetical protein
MFGMMLLQYIPPKFPQSRSTKSPPQKRYRKAAANMTPLPKHLSGDKAAISEFIDKFDVR